MENTNELTQEERFNNLQDFKRNLSARIQEHITKRQQEIEKYKREKEVREREERIRNGNIKEEDLDYIDYE